MPKERFIEPQRFRGLLRKAYDKGAQPLNVTPSGGTLLADARTLCSHYCGRLHRPRFGVM